LAGLEKIVLLIAEMKTHPDLGGLFPSILSRILAIGAIMSGFILIENPGVLRAFPGSVLGNPGLNWARIPGAPWWIGKVRQDHRWGSKKGWIPQQDRADTSGTEESSDREPCRTFFENVHRPFGNFREQSGQSGKQVSGIMHETFPHGNAFRRAVV
jgi:hypothetical protein